MSFLSREKNIVVFALTLALFCTSCLKTRSQIKNSKDDDDAPASQTPAPVPASKYEIEELKHEITRVSGKLEELEHNQQVQAGNADSASKESVKALDARIAEVEKNQVLIMSELKDLKEKQAAKESAVAPDQAIADGFQLLKEKKYDAAAEKFKAVLNKVSKGTVAAEAHFGMGEVEFATKSYKKAILSYSKVQEASSKSTHVPTSLYKIGVSFQNLNMKKEARGFFGELIERYPKSAEAKKARARLKDKT